MATHDVGATRRTAAARHGLHHRARPAVPDEKIYIRLEDVIVINEKGAEVVSTEAPVDIDAIEKVMKEEGMLERYKLGD